MSGREGHVGCVFDVVESSRSQIFAVDSEVRVCVCVGEAEADIGEQRQTLPPNKSGGNVREGGMHRRMEGCTVRHEGSTNLSPQENLPLGEWELALLNRRSGFGKPVRGNGTMEVDKMEGGQLRLRHVRERATPRALCVAVGTDDKDSATVGLSLSRMLRSVSPHLPTVPLASQPPNESRTSHVVSDMQSFLPPAHPSLLLFSIAH